MRASSFYLPPFCICASLLNIFLYKFWMQQFRIYQHLLFLMRLHIFTLALLFSLLSSGLNSESTILTYIIEHQTDQADNYVQLSLTVQSEGKSLKKAIGDAAAVIKDIKQIATTHCLSKFKNKKDCAEIVEVSQYQVEPKYHLVRKIQTFTLFIVTHDLTIKIKNLVGLGKMADLIISHGDGLVTLHDFAWKTDKEVDSEKETIRQGIKQGKELCEKLGKTFEEIISIQQLELPVEQEQGEQEERDADLAEVDIQLDIFKFKVKCNNKNTKQTKKK